MISLATVRQFVLSACTPLAPRTLPATEALGCTTVSVVIAADPVPSFANSAMDGFALSAADVVTLPTVLRVVTSIAAGEVSDIPLGAGDAARIMTGAPLPDGADTVCPVEQVRYRPAYGVVEILAPVWKGAHVRWPGEDIQVGDRVIEPGTQLSPGHLGLLASLGIETVAVVDRPRVGILSTGDELTSGPGPMAPGVIRDANRLALMAAVRQSGFVAVDLGIVGDDEDAVTTALLASVARCDAVVTSGGVSVGDFDVMRRVLQTTCGRSARWVQIAMKPGKPFAFGTLTRSGVPVFALPGNPVAALVSFELVVRPALRLLGGHRLLYHPVLRGIASAPIERKRDGKLHVVRAIASVEHCGHIHVRPVGPQASHQLRAMADANALVLLPDGDGVGAGATVEVLVPAMDRLEACAVPAVPAEAEVA